MLNSRSSNLAARRRINFSQKTRTSINSLTTCETNDRLGKKGNSKGGISMGVDFAAARRPAKTEHLGGVRSMWGVVRHTGRWQATSSSSPRRIDRRWHRAIVFRFSVITADAPPPVTSCPQLSSSRLFFRLKLNSVSVSIRVFLHSPPVYARRVSWSWRYRFRNNNRKQLLLY